MHQAVGVLPKRFEQLRSEHAKRLQAEEVRLRDFLPDRTEGDGQGV